MEQLSIEFLKIEQDNQSGSVTIVDKTIHCLLEFCTRSENLEPVVSDLRGSLQQLVSAHNQFGALHHLHRELSVYVGKREKPFTGQTLSDFLTEYRDKWGVADLDLAKAVFRHIELENKCLLLHSKSSAVTNTFQYFRERGGTATIIQTESRPAFEGRKQAEILLELGFEVRLIVDSAVSTVIDQLDLALLGADNVTPQFFVNKIGSYGIILLCREFGIPIFVVADTRKFMTPESLRDEEPKNQREIWKSGPSELAITNFYFERIPNNLVNGFITEETLETSQSLPGLINSRFS